MKLIVSRHKIQGSTLIAACRIYVMMHLFIMGYFPISAQTNNGRAATRAFIKSNWKNAIHINTSDSGTLLGLPKPYSVPGTGGAFQEMYYWDTYFTNAGLIRDGAVEQAKNNVANIVYLVNRFGFMPNGNRTFFLVRSQSPYLSMMIRDIYEFTHDTEWLRSVLPALKKEYSFWMEKRLGPAGLNHYGDMAGEARKLSMFAAADKRLGLTKKMGAINDSMKVVLGANLIAECESGWDFTPRFDSRCAEYFPVDLNCNLYMYETNFSFFDRELGHLDGAGWQVAADKRKKLLDKYCLDPRDDLYYDYNYITGTRSPILSAAVFNVLWSGVADKKNAGSIHQHLPRLEARHGIVACEQGNRSSTYQWDSPNGWANLQFVAIKGLDRYGFKTDAMRLCEKYMDVVADNFLRTNKIWEKYNMVDGSLNATNEYGLPELMGWTAGVFSFCMDYYNEHAKQF